MFRRRAYVRLIRAGAGIGRDRSRLLVSASGMGGQPQGWHLEPRSSHLEIKSGFGFTARRWPLCASEAAVRGERPSQQQGDCGAVKSLAWVESKVFEIPNVRDFDSTVRKIDSTDLIRSDSSRKIESYARVVRNLESRVAYWFCGWPKFPGKTRASPLKIRHLERSKFLE